MTAPLWPQHTGTARAPLSLVGTLVHWRSMRAVASVLGLVALYYAGLFAPLPGLRQAEAAAGAGWWFMELLDFLFTGGAFGRGSLFALGTFALLATGGRPGLLRKLGKLFLLAVVFGLIYLARGRLVLQPGQIVKFLLLAVAGGASVYFITRWLAAHKGPRPLHLNVILLFHRQVEDLMREGAGASVWVLAGLALLLGGTTFVLLRKRVLIEVMHIKDKRTRRFATMEVRGADEYSIDSLGVVGIVLFLSLAAPVSMLMGWLEITGRNFVVFASCGAVIVLSLWFLLSLLGRALRRKDLSSGLARAILDSGQTPILEDPYRLSINMLKSFWIISGVAAGEATERFIEGRRRIATRMIFLTLTSWFVVLTVFEVWVARRYGGLVLFSYGSTVFMACVLMLVAYLSILSRHLRIEFRQLAEVRRGKARVVEQTYAVRASAGLSELKLSSGEPDYWEKDKLQVEAMIDWLRVVKRIGVEPGSPRVSRRWRLRVILANVGVALLSGLAIAALGALFYLLVDPSAEQMMQLVIPLFLGGALTPNILWKWMRRGGRSGPVRDEQKPRES